MGAVESASECRKPRGFTEPRAGFDSRVPAERYMEDDMSEITVADWKRQGVELRERLEAERDTLRHRLDQVTSDIIEIDRTLGTRPTPSVRQPMTQVAPTVIRRNRHEPTTHVQRMIVALESKGGSMLRADLVQRLVVETGKGSKRVQSMISEWMHKGLLSVQGVHGKSTVVLRRDRLNGAAEATAH